jgi:hypothetical protein
MANDLLTETFYHVSFPILWTRDLEETMMFYENILGFASRSNFPNFVTYEWCRATHVYCSHGRA